MADRVPRELLSKIFRFISKQKLSRKDILQLKSGYHLVPCLQPISRVCLEWRRIVLDDKAAWVVVIRILGGKKLGSQFKAARDILRKHAGCAVILSLDLGRVSEQEYYGDRVDLEISSLLAISSTNVRAIETRIYDTDLHFVLLSLIRRLQIPNLELLYTSVNVTPNVGYLGEEIGLESENVLSGSMLPSLEDTQILNSEALLAPLHYSELQSLVSLRILTQCYSYAPPTWDDLCGIIRRSPHLETLFINLSRNDIGEWTSPSEVCLPHLKKCFLEAAISRMWQFLSMRNQRLKYVSLSFLRINPGHSPFPTPSAVVANNFSSLVYLSLRPLCFVTARFLADATLPSLATLVVACSDLRAGLSWPSTISLPALTTLRIVDGNADTNAVKLFLQALSKHTGTPPVLRTLTLDINLSDTPDLMDGVSETLFSNLASLSIERMADSACELAKVLALMPSVERLILGRSPLDGQATVLPHPPETHKSSGNGILPRLRSLEVAFSKLLMDKDGAFDFCEDLLVQGEEEAILLEYVRERFNSDSPLESLRINPRLGDETKERIEGFGCRVEDGVDFNHRLDFDREFDQLE